SEQTESCYTFLGPVARSWFRFIDCAQVLELPLRERLDLIWLPTAQYQRPEVVAKLREFVARGGTLVCTDPLAFSNDTLGNDTAASRQELFGVTVGEPTEQTQLRPVSGAPEGELTLPGVAYALAPSPGVTVLATYEDGSPAVTDHRMGEGASDPLRQQPNGLQRGRGQGLAGVLCRLCRGGP
ncbi:MAG TPA: beta-galactosidase trimerization domain-containing protein, partial [Armatimonadota bacterium]|nr:beta-galactosidase trimerization domain-containing protein [Armatimonadota bacterium]